jgi:hypothetical protein
MKFETKTKAPAEAGALFRVRFTYSTPSSSTSNFKVAFSGMTGG